MIESSLFPNIADSKASAILQTGQLMTLPKGKTVFQAGSPCQHYLIVLEGSVKVFQSSADGKSIVLYRVQNNESCVLTTTSLFAQKAYSATGITETQTTALALSKENFQKGIATSDAFRNWVFEHYQKRLQEILHLIGQVTFECLDKRLGQYLLESSNDNYAVSTTHQNLADELGTSREVVSRRLKELEHLKLLTLSRGKISIIEPTQLQSYVT